MIQTNARTQGCSGAEKHCARYEPMKGLTWGGQDKNVAMVPERNGVLPF